MPTWTSRAQIKEALQHARREAKQARDQHGPGSAQVQAALKKCNNIQAVLDKWDGK